MKAIQTFQLEQADQYWCNVDFFTTSHSSLYVEAKYKDDVRFICFSSMKYYQGPLVWQGLNFQIASTQEMLAFSRGQSRFDSLPNEHILEVCTLYYLDKPRQ